MLYDPSAQGTQGLEPVQQVRMISSISSKLVKWLLKAEAISQQDKELYEYAAYSFLFSFMPLVLVMIVGGLLGMFFEGIALILPFMLIRKFSGGYHLNSSKVCFFLSTTIITLSLLLIKHIIATETVIYYVPFVVIAAIQIFIASPIDSEARQLRVKERCAFKKVARVMVALNLCLFLVALGLNWNRFAACTGCGIALTAILQWPCIIKSVLRKVELHI